MADSLSRITIAGVSLSLDLNYDRLAEVQVPDIKLATLRQNSGTFILEDAFLRDGTPPITRDTSTGAPCPSIHWHFRSVFE